MILSAGDLALEIDFGRNLPGAILQRKEKGEWQDYLIDGKAGDESNWCEYTAAGLVSVTREVKPRPLVTGVTVQGAAVDSVCCDLVRLYVGFLLC